MSLFRSGTNFSTIDENIAPVHEKKNERRLSLAVPKISFSSPTPVPSPSSEKNDILSRDITPRKDTSKRKYPLIVGKLNDEAKRIFGFRNQNKNIKSNERDNNSTPSRLQRQMDTLRVPKSNLLRKTSTSAIPPKIQRVVGNNNKPYYVLQDETLNNFLYYNKQGFKMGISSPKSPLIVEEAKSSSFEKSKDKSRQANGFLNDQLGKLETVGIPNAQTAPNDNQIMSNNLTPSLGTRPGWMSPAPYSGKTGGRRVSITMNQFSYNFK